MKPSIGEGSSIRPGSWTEAKAQDGSPGNLGDPAHAHVRTSRQSGRRLNMDPGPEGTLRPSGSASASCETQTEEGSDDREVEVKRHQHEKRPDAGRGKR